MEAKENLGDGQFGYMFRGLENAFACIIWPNLQSVSEEVRLLEQSPTQFNKAWQKQMGAWLSD